MNQGQDLMHEQDNMRQGLGESPINPLYVHDIQGKYRDESVPGKEGLNVGKDQDNAQSSSAVIIPSFELENWYNQLQDRVVIGLCHGERPSQETLRAWMNQNWTNKNIKVNHVQYLPNGYYLFFCNDSNSALQIASQGQWILRNTPNSVFNWYVGFNPKGPKPTKEPFWVDFVDLPVELYPWLKHIGSFVGRVLVRGLEEA
ncbi:hypothetical protein L7F22_048855 [Adiantum nelumboides]|nr:hypothetical protein [Adiantum nelumboides]